MNPWLGLSLENENEWRFPTSEQASTDRHIGFIPQKVLYTTTPGRQSGHVRAQAAAPAGLAVTSPPSLNPLHSQDPHASTNTRPTHHLPAAGDVCGITARHRLTRSRKPGRCQLPSSRHLEPPQWVCGRIRPPNLHLRMHSVAVSLLWQCTAGAQRLSVVLGLAHLRQPVSFVSRVPRDIARVGHD